MMGAPTIMAIMQGLATRLATISQLNTSPIHPDTVTVPIAVVGLPSTIDYHSTFGRGYCELDFAVTVLVSAADDTAGQTALASYIDPTGSNSIITALYTDKTLGGLVADIIVRGFRPLGAQEVNNIGYYGGLWTVHVIAQGS